MPEAFETVVPPANGVYRFDGARSGDKPPYQVVYCASTPEGAFGETLAQFRPSLSLLAQLKTIADDENDDPEVDFATTGRVSRDWRMRRQIAHAHVRMHQNLPCVDVTAAPSQQILRTRLAPLAARLNLPEVDTSTLTGSNREFTQACSRYIHDQTDDLGNPAFAGIRYLSRLGADWECWAFFSDRVRFEETHAETIEADNEALAEVTRLFQLSIEGLE